MKRLFVALSTLALLLVAVPASAVPTVQANVICNPATRPEIPIETLTTDINTNVWRGSLCLKACKSEFAACKKASATLRKCKNAESKAASKTSALRCQLFGNPKKTCTDAAKSQLKLELDLWKSKLTDNKVDCEAAYQTCKAACAAP